MNSGKKECIFQGGGCKSVLLNERTLKHASSSVREAALAIRVQTLSMEELE